MAKGALRVSDLEFRYPDYHNLHSGSILSNIDFALKPGSINIIFGGAESGKSTLASIITALVPAHTGGRLSGSVYIDDIDILKTHPSEIIESCGLVFQDPEKQTVTTDCFSEAAFSLESLGLPVEEITARVNEAFSMLGIERLIDSGTEETSGGEKKKIALAGLIALNPDLWILDETFEELDNPSRNELFRILIRSKKTVLIFASKYFDAFRQADSYYMLRDGILSAEFSQMSGLETRRRMINAGISLDFAVEKRRYSRKTETKSLKAEKQLLSADNISYTYPCNGPPSNGSLCSGFSMAVDRFSLAEGEVLSIVGRNGCGKSTLAALLCGLLEPSSGSIKVADESGAQRAASAAVLNSFCAYMFQNPDYQIFLPTVKEELSFGLKEAGYSPGVIEAMIDQAISDFDLPGAEAPPALLSYSVKKRLQAAVYFLLKRPVFILDEADTGLSYKDFFDLVSRLKQISRGLIIITHNLQLASVVSDRIIGMSGGRVSADSLEQAPDKLEQWLEDSGVQHD